MVEERNSNEYTFEIHPAGAGDNIRQRIGLPEGTIRSVSYTPADELLLYDPQERAPIRNVGLTKTRQGSHQEVHQEVTTGPGGSLTRPTLRRGQEERLELYEHAAALHVAEEDELYWYSSLFRGRTESDPGGTLKITLVDKERAIRTYSPGDLVELTLRLYDDGGIHEVTSRFVWGARQPGRVRQPVPDLHLRGHGHGAIEEEEVTVRTRLRSNIHAGYYTCEYIEVRDLGGTPARINNPNPPIIIRVEPQGTPNPVPELREWRFPNA
jgi:hypothetical protein